jgi:hypothetical protein
MNLIVETNTYGFATGSKYPGCLDQGKVCLGGGINGDWAGSTERALQMASWLKDLGFNAGSQKRSRKLTASGNRSDHWDGSKDSYGIDLPCRGEKGNNGWKKLREEFVKRGWVSEDKMPDRLLQKGNGKWINFNVGNYRYQVGWNVTNHYDHIHVGVRNTKPDDKYSPTDDSETKDVQQKPDQTTPKIKKIFYTAFSSGEQSIIKSVLEKLGTLGVKDNFSKIVLAALVIKNKDLITTNKTTSNTEAQSFIDGLNDKTFNTLDECLDYFEKELGENDFNRSEIKTIAEKFEVKVESKTGGDIKFDLENFKAFMNKFEKHFSNDKEISEIKKPKINLEEKDFKLNEEISRIKDIMKKIL